jgi:hypothetical protein
MTPQSRQPATPELAIGQIHFDRHFRTPTSEGYHIFSGQVRLATVDLHFTSTTVHCTLIVEQDLSRDALARLIERIDEDLVLSADTPRDDLLVNVYRGSEIGFFTDSFHADEDELVAELGGDEEDEDEGGEDGL